MGMRRLAQRGRFVALSAGITAVLVATAAMAQSASIATHTTLATETHEISGRAVIAYSATVLDEDGAPATGIVRLQERSRSVASAALNSEGKAEILVGGLVAGEHTLRAVYGGDAAHGASQSDAVTVQSDAAASAPSSFTLAITPASLPASGQTLVPGDSGNVTATITSVNGFTGFVSLSCAGAPVSPGSYTDNALPVGVTCTFTPTNLQITSTVANSTNPTLTSYLTVQTTAPAGANGLNRKPNGLPGQNSGNTLALAVLLPGVLGLGLLGRKRKLFGRVALLLLVGGITVLGTSACNARYKYLNHPPTPNYGTLPGAYTLTVWAQTSDGVTASEQFTTLGLTVAN
jgi:Bacterial Ig-like domain (group 3)